MSNTPTFVEAITSFVDDRLRGLHVGMPGRVEAYDSGTQRAEIQPLIQRGYIDEDGSRQTETLPVLADVPIIFMRAAGFSITFPISKGDTVWLMFSDFSIDKWLKQGGLVDPLDDRNHTLSDAVAFAGLNHSPTDQVDSGSMVLGATGLKLGSKDASEKVLKGDSYISAEATWVDALNTYLAVVATATGTSGAHGTFITATGVFKTAGTTAKSTKVETD